MKRSKKVQQTTNIADVFRGMFKRKLLLLLMPLLCLLLAQLFLSVSSPSYLSESQVIIENRSTPFDQTNSVQEQTMSTEVGERVVASQVSAIESHDIVDRVVEQLALETNSSFNKALKPIKLSKSLAISMGFSEDPRKFQPQQLAAKTLVESLTVYPVPESNVIGIKAVADDPKMAADIANAIAETYVLSTREIGTSDNGRVKNWLQQQIEDLRLKVSASDGAVEKYRIDSGLLRGTTATLGTQQISELNSQITVAETAVVEAQARAEEIKNLIATQGTVDASADVLGDAIVQRLREQQVTAQSKYEELSGTYLQSHPKMIAVKKELDSVNNQVRKQALRVADSLLSQKKIAEQRANSLRAQLGKLKGTQAEANFSDVKLQALERESEANRTLLQNMLNRYADANSRQEISLNPGFARIIQKAVVPAVPYFPKPGPTLLLAGIAGLILGLGFAFVFESIASSTIRVIEEDVEDQPRRKSSHFEQAQGQGMPSLSPYNQYQSAPAQTKHDLSQVDAMFKNMNWQSAPQPATPPPELMPQVFDSFPAASTPGAVMTLIEAQKSGRDSKFTQSIKRLTGTILGLNSEKAFKSFSFASLGSSAPNAALAVIALGRELSNQGHKVIALDLSTSPVNLELLMSLKPGPGIAELMTGQADFTRIVSRDGESNFHVIRMGQAGTNETTRFLQEKFPSILATLQSAYHVVLVHAGDAASALVTALSSCNLAVILASETRIRDAQMAMRSLETNNGTRTMLLRLDTDE